MALDTLALVAKEAFTAAASAAMRRMLGHRADEAFADLMEELRLASISPEEAAADDATAARLLAFFMAMSQGAARRNLRVMAQIIAKRTAHPLKHEDDFVVWAEIVARLRREEVILLATQHRHQMRWLKDFDQDVHDGENEQAMLQASKDAREELIGLGKPFKFELAYVATATALSRTGLLIEYPIIDGKTFQTTALMRELANMIRLEDWARDALVAERLE